MMRLRGWRTLTSDFKGLWTIWRPRPASTGCLSEDEHGDSQGLSAIRIIKHEAVPGCGSFEAPDDRPTSTSIGTTSRPAGLGQT